MLFKFAVLPRRVVTVPAPIIAIIGSDGSGKSTIAREIAGRLDTKIDTRLVYFGSGDGPTSLARLPLIGLRKMWQSPLVRRRVNRTRGSDGRKASEIVSVPPLAKGLWAVAVARERKAKMRLVKKYTSASIVVVTDRYPQNEFQGNHDGPRLGDWLTPPVERCASKVAQWEQGQYRDLAESPPDLLILLDIDVETAKKRRPEETVAELERRIAVARELRYSDTERLVIDAASPLDVVVNTAMKRVLELIAR